MIRSLLSSLARRALKRLTENWPARLIYGGDAESIYLSRWYVIGSPTMSDGSSPFDRFGNPKVQAIWPNRTLGLYVHRFHRSDVDRELHNHPWSWALSLVLAGGYREERRFGSRVVSRVVPPLSLNWIGGNDYHRVDLIEEDAWSLFLVGPKVSSWSFWDRRTGKVTPWREFLQRTQWMTT